ncbi:hypothetical protein [Leptolyngbya ohadii]|uniref:hypothetical protein n=1 Tax=Leptolyngbya ohadii TaxID=1962290 RepID=UPI000B59FE16|nr:hypothetical protein [Leptolyngbya ohadii]
MKDLAPFHQNQSDPITALKALTIPHPFFREAFRGAVRCLQSGTPALIIGYCSGLTTLAKTLESHHPNSLAIQVPFCLPTERKWRELFLHGLDTLRQSTGESQGVVKSASLSELHNRFLLSLVQHQKSSVILDDASNLLCASSPRRFSEDLNYLKFLLHSRTNYLLSGNCELLKILDFGPIFQQLNVIHLPPRYRGPEGLKVFQVFLEILKPSLLIEEPPALGDVEFFFEGSLANIPLLKNWFIRALSVAIQERACSVQKRHFEVTVLSVARRRKILDSILQHESFVAALSDSELPELTGKVMWRKCQHSQVEQRASKAPRSKA